MHTLYSVLILPLVIAVGCSGPDLSSTSARSSAPAAVFSVLDYEATGDGETKDTKAIQRAIDTAAGAGGGTVYFPAGRYLSGTIFLKSMITLHLEAGAVLLGSTELDDFPQISPEFKSFTDGYVIRSLIYGENLHDIAIVGRGTIDGQGAAYLGLTSWERPYNIRIISCRNVLIENITLKNSPMWMQHYLNCDFVTLRGLHIDDMCNQNNDMIDIDCSHNVLISDCHGNSYDDAITLKSTGPRTTENVTITNCTVGSYSNGIKMGTESNGGFKNITISNCTINSQFNGRECFGQTWGKGGLALEIVDGGTLENITVSNIVITGVRVPIFLRLGDRARHMKDMEKPAVGSYRNVVLSNIIATDVGRYGSSITGLPGHPIENVTLSNIRITYPGGGTSEDAAKKVPELPDEYPEGIMFGDLPAYGFYCRHVDGLRFSNIDLGLEKGDYRPAMVFDDVKNLEVDGFAVGENVKEAGPMFLMKDVSGATLRACRTSPEAKGFLRLEGKTKQVSVFTSDLSGVIMNPFEFGEGVPKSVLHQYGNRMRQ